MKKIITLLFIFSLFLCIFAEEKYLRTTVVEKEYLYGVELTGVGYALRIERDTIKDYKSFMIKVLSKVKEVEVVKGKTTKVAVEQKILFSPSAIRLGYVTYPIEIKEFTETSLEADVYEPRVTKLGYLVKAKKIGSLLLTITEPDGLKGGKGTLNLYFDNKRIPYEIYFYEPDNVCDAFYRWAPELK